MEDIEYHKNQLVKDNLIYNPQIVNNRDEFLKIDYNKTGIFFQKALGPGRANHIDVWNGNLRKPRAGSGLYISGEIWFWEIK